MAEIVSYRSSRTHARAHRAVMTRTKEEGRKKVKAPRRSIFSAPRNLNLGVIVCMSTGRDLTLSRDLKHCVLISVDGVDDSAGFDIIFVACRAEIFAICISVREVCHAWVGDESSTYDGLYYEILHKR